jgi:hypothetical protein
MTASGHQRRWAVLVIMSAFPLRPDLRGRTVLGRFGGGVMDLAGFFAIFFFLRLAIKPIHSMKSVRLNTPETPKGSVLNAKWLDQRA